jgi:hypothetical protein
VEIRRVVARSDKAETNQDRIDIVYSGRGMPFRVTVSSLCWGNGGWVDVVPVYEEIELLELSQLSKYYSNVSELIRSECVVKCVVEKCIIVILEYV